MANLDIIIRAQNLASAALQQLEGQLSGVQRQSSFAERGFGGLQRVVGTGLVAAGAAATAGLAAVGAGLVKSVTAAADFESQINVLTVAARSSGTTMEQLSKAALQVGADSDLVGISASEAADAMTNFYKAGLSTNEIFSDLQGYLAGTAPLTGALRAAIDLAAASELDLAAASDVVAVSMATFGLEASDAARIANVLVGAADASLASVGGLAEGMKNVGPAASAMGISLEDTSTALAILSTRGIQGAEAGTAMRSMLLNLQRPTDAVTGALDELGVALYNADGTMKSLPDVIGQLEGALSGLTEEQRQQYAMTLAGSYGLSAFNTLVGEGSAGWNDMATSIANAATAQETAAARTKGFNAAMEQLGGAMESFMISVGTPLIQSFLTPVAQKMGDAIAKGTELAQTIGDEMKRGFEATGTYLGAFMEALDNFLPDEQTERVWQFIDAVTSIKDRIMAVLGPITSAIGQFVSWKDVLIVLAGVVASIVIPILWGIVTAAAPVIAVFAALVGAVALIRNAWERDWGGIQEKVQAVIGFFTPAFERIKAAFVKAGENIAPLGEKLSALLTAAEPAMKAIGVLANAIGVVLVVALDVLLNAFAAVIPAIVAIVGVMVDQLTAFFEAITQLWESSVALIKAIAAGDWSAAWAAVQEIVQVFADYWSATLGNMLAVGKTIFTAIVSTILGTLTDLGVDWQAGIAAIQTVWGTFWDGVKSRTQSAMDWLQPVTETLGGWLQMIQGGDWGGLVNAVFPSIGALLTSASATISAFDWMEWLVPFEWPELELFDWEEWIDSFEWPRLPSFSWSMWVSSFRWPSLPAFSWGDWIARFSWPSFNWGDWIGRFQWPSLPSFNWSNFVPSINWSNWIPSFPGWSALLKALGIGSNAAGSGFFTGGFTLVGERGPEIVALPRGSRIESSERTSRMMGGGVTVNVYATVGNQMDIDEMAWRVAQTIQRRQR